ncbi:hypothetical protein [Desulfatitalea alkaliphila]|uniref:Type II secretion system protein GspC N-terminal domain-containing protein n=1 Tax=Desulfatitalea alkaliphila TaxID=2929485 RepID=A0AA41UNC1_9BACT|nr:hypothetical protein [Desulfatitalea alkaliphila]MCJ8499378.1 hypothetical protein [Desulfatitalea alkaliphila]
MITRIVAINLALALVGLLLLIATIGVWRNPPPLAETPATSSAHPQESPVQRGTTRLNEPGVPPKSAFNNIGARNLFSPDRREMSAAETEEDIEELTAVAEEAPAPKVDGRLIQLFGVVLAEELTTALVSDPSVRTGRGQNRWVRPGDRIGQLEVERIEPEAVIFADDQSKRFRVALHSPDKSRSSAGAASSPGTPRPTVVTTQPTPEPRPAARPETRDAAPSGPDRTTRDGTGTDEQEYVIIKTPFGDIKRPKSQP